MAHARARFSLFFIFLGLFSKGLIERENGNSFRELIGRRKSRLEKKIEGAEENQQSCYRTRVLSTDFSIHIENKWVDEKKLSHFPLFHAQKRTRAIREIYFPTWEKNSICSNLNNFPFISSQDAINNAENRFCYFCIPLLNLSTKAKSQ